MALRILQYSDVENAYDRPERIGRLAGLIEARRDPETLVVGTGDDTAPGVLALVAEGRQSLEFFDAVRPDLETFGNHDFDYGLEATRTVVRESPQTWVSANVRYDGERFGADVGVVPSTVLEAGDSSVGFVGVTDPRTPSMCPNATGLTFTDPEEAVARESRRLRDRGVDYVVVLSHVGDDAALARAGPVDAVLGGHVHEPRVDRAAGALLTRPGANGRWLVEADLEAGEATTHRVDEAPLGDGVADALAARVEAAGLDEVVARVEEPIPRSRAARKDGESRIGNFVADAYRWATGADVALQNTGGIRRGPPLEGPVTVADLVSVVPFDEPVAVVELSGAELEAVCRQGDGSTVPDVPSYWHAHVSGMQIRRNGSGVDVSVGGAPVDPGATYTLATSNYLLHTEREFPALAEHHRVETAGTQYELLADYARTVGIDPSLEGRVVLDDRGKA